MTTHTALVLTRKYLAAVAVSVVAAIALSGSAAGTAAAHDASDTVVQATKEYRSKTPVGVLRTKEW